MTLHTVSSLPLSLCRWLGLHAGGLAGFVVVFFFFFFDRCLKEEVGMAEVGHGSWVGVLLSPMLLSFVGCQRLLVFGSGVARFQRCGCRCSRFLGFSILGCSDW